MNIEEIVQTALSEIAAARGAADLEAVRIKYLGRKSGLNEAMSKVTSLPSEERKALGQSVNEAKGRIEAALQAATAALESARLADLAETESIDVTFPAPALKRGHRHVLTAMQRDLEHALEKIGYHVEVGPEVETDWYNFEALNTPPGHASRDMQETFFLNEDESVVLRTQTSPVQIRAMERLKPPLYVIAPGRTYRRDPLDASHSPYFHQLEGLAIDHGLTVGDLKGTLIYMIESVVGKGRKVRMRPHHFPFTEPSYEFDMSCGICGGKGCRSCGGNGYLELGGCGMVHPNVLRNGGIDPEEWSGYAWGFGIERLAMIRHDIDDLRLFYENDMRFNEQFG